MTDLIPTPDATWSRTRLDLPDGMTFEAWLEVGKKLRSVEQSVMWWIGDWLAFGEGRYGETYTGAIAETGYSYATLAQAKSVALSYQPCDRSQNLSWSHHLAAVSLPVLERREVLGLAVDSGWSKRELTEEVQRRKAVDLVQFQSSPESPFGYALRCMARLVAAVFDLDPGSFIGEKKGAPNQVHARQVLMYLLVSEAEFRESDVAAGLGRHHSTVSHAVQSFIALRDDATIDDSFSRLGEMYRYLREAQASVPALVQEMTT